MIGRQIDSDSDSEIEIRQKSPSPAKQQNKTPTVRLISPVKSQNHTTSKREREESEQVRNGRNTVITHDHRTTAVRSVVIDPPPPVHGVASSDSSLSPLHTSPSDCGDRQAEARCVTVIG